MESDAIAPQLILQLILILINAFFAATEIAVISLNATKLKHQAESGDKKASRMLRMVAEPTGFLSAIQIGITLAGFLGSAFAADHFSDRLVRWLVDTAHVRSIPEATLDTLAVIFITLILSYFTLVFGELVPKRIAMKKSESIARAVSGLMRGLSVVLKPLIWLLTVSTNGMLRLLGMDPKETEDDVSEEEIMLMVDAGAEEGAIEAEEKQLIANVFSLNDKCAEDVMVHRSLATFLWADDSRDEILSTILETGFSRFPVRGENQDDIIGILHAKRYLTSLQSGEAVTMTDCLLPVHFVPESACIQKIFMDMQKQHLHMEVVVDSFGGVVGLITMEDILEELVGEIWDESDTEETPFLLETEGCYLVDCSAKLRELAAALKLTIESDADTVGGWVTEQFGRIPQTGESFLWNDCLRVTAILADARRVSQVRVRRETKPATGADAASK